MKTSLYVIIATLIPLSAAAAVFQGSQDVQRLLNAAGYTEVRDVEFSDGLWEAEARIAKTRWQEVHIDPKNGEIFSDKNPSISLAEIAQRLQSAGYRDVHDLDRDGGIWDAEATNSAGQRVELRIAGTDGRVLYSEIDYSDVGYDD